MSMTNCAPEAPHVFLTNSGNNPGLWCLKSQTEDSGSCFHSSSGERWMTVRQALRFTELNFSLQLPPNIFKKVCCFVCQTTSSYLIKLAMSFHVQRRNEHHIKRLLTVHTIPGVINCQHDLMNQECLLSSSQAQSESATDFLLHL